MRGDPLFSVLVPVHDAGEFLRPTIASVLAQTLADFEVVLVDDGSSDGGVEAIEKIGDPRIRVFRQARGGAAAALQVAARAARGEFLALLDHDDLWLPRKLERHLELHLARPEADLTFSWTGFVDERGEPLGLPIRRWQGPISFDELLVDFVIRTTSAIVVRRTAVERAGGFDPALARIYDLDLTLRVAELRPGNCLALPEVLTLYRRHPGQMSRRWREVRKEWELLLARISGLARAPSRAVLALADSNMHRYFAWLAAEQGDFRGAARLLAAAVRRSPLRAARDGRNWLVAASTAAGLLLPLPLHARLSRLAWRASRPPD